MAKFKKPKNVTRLEEAIEYIDTNITCLSYVNMAEVKLILKAARTHLRTITVRARHNRKTIRGRSKAYGGK